MTGQKAKDDRDTDRYEWLALGRPGSLSAFRELKRRNNGTVPQQLLFAPMGFPNLPVDYLRGGGCLPVGSGIGGLSSMGGLAGFGGLGGLGLGGQFGIQGVLPMGMGFGIPGTNMQSNDRTLLAQTLCLFLLSGRSARKWQVCQVIFLAGLPEHVDRLVL